MKEKSYKILILGFIVVVIVLLSLLIYGLKDKGGKCLANPMVYSASKLMEQAHSTSIGCMCHMPDRKSYVVFDNSTAVQCSDDVPFNECIVKGGALIDD